VILEEVDWSTVMSPEITEAIEAMQSGALFYSLPRLWPGAGGLPRWRMARAASEDPAGVGDGPGSRRFEPAD
jgi:hypothetical protein